MFILAPHRRCSSIYTVQPVLLQVLSGGNHQLSQVTYAHEGGLRGGGVGEHLKNGLATGFVYLRRGGGAAVYKLQAQLPSSLHSGGVSVHRGPS